MESWYNDFCPKCETVNWWCNGDESDLTRPDIEAVKCRKCKSIWSLEDREITNDEDSFYEEGQSKR